MKFPELLRFRRLKLPGATTDRSFEFFTDRPDLHEDPRVFGGILSTDPLIAIGKRQRYLGKPFGLLDYIPHAFVGRPSLYFLCLASTHEAPKYARALADDIRAARAELPECRIVVIANTRGEWHLFQEAGVESIFSTLLTFINENVYDIVEPEPDKTFDAVYSARFEELKRHHLATAVDKLLLLYFKADDLDQWRKKMPKATFGNHDLNGGAFRNYYPPAYCEVLQRARVGLCLSEAEGPMRVSAEYALCGLPVISTPSIGGRDVLFDRRFARVVPSDPYLIAEAVRDFVEQNPDPREVRADVMRAINERRRDFLEAFNRLVAEVFPGQFRLDRFDRLLDLSVSQTRPLSKARVAVLGT